MQTRSRRRKLRSVTGSVSAECSTSISSSCRSSDTEYMSSVNTLSPIDTAKCGTSQGDAREMKGYTKVITFDTKRFCFFCYKKYPETPEAENDDPSHANAELPTVNEHGEMSSRFMQLISRYLELTYLPLKERGNRVNCLSCDACFVQLKNICNQFQELEKVKLQLDLGISNLIGVMKCADKSKSRLMAFHEAVVEGEDGMSTDVQALMNAFRRSVVTQSARKTFPRVLVKRLHIDPAPYEAASYEFNKDQEWTNVNASELQQGKEIHIRLPTSSEPSSSRSTLLEFPIMPASAAAAATPPSASSRGPKRNSVSESIHVAKVAKTGVVEGTNTIPIIPVDLSNEGVINDQDTSSPPLDAVDNSIRDNRDIGHEASVITINDDIYEDVSESDVSNSSAESSSLDFTGSPPHFDATLNTTNMDFPENEFPPPGHNWPKFEGGLPTNFSRHQYESDFDTYEASFGTDFHQADAAHIGTSNGIFQPISGIQQSGIIFENQNPNFPDGEFNGEAGHFTNGEVHYDNFVIQPTPPESDNSNDNFPADVQLPSYVSNEQHNLAALPEPFQILYRNQPTSFVFAAIDSNRWEEREPYTYIPSNFVGCRCFLSIGNDHYEGCPRHWNAEAHQNESSTNFDDDFQNHGTQNGEDDYNDSVSLDTDACYTNDDNDDNGNSYGYDSDDDTSAVFHSLKIEPVN